MNYRGTEDTQRKRNRKQMKMTPCEFVVGGRHPRRIGVPKRRAFRIACGGEV